MNLLCDHKSLCIAPLLLLPQLHDYWYTERDMIFSTIRSVVAGLGLFALIALFPTSAFAQQAERITNFDSRIEVQENGTVVVTETITYDFGANDRHGIFRYLPTAYLTNEGNTLVIPTDILSITDEEGNDYPYELITPNSSTIEAKIGDPDATITGEHIYRIRYIMYGVIDQYESADELYWNITGNGWTVPIQSARAEIILPSATAPELNATACYTGVRGTTESACSISSEDNQRYIIESDRGLAYFEGLTAAIAFEKGMIRPYSTLIVETDPIESRVTVNGRSHSSENPIEVRLSEGVYAVSASKIGYISEQESILVQSDAPTTLRLSLQKNWAWSVLQTALPIGLFAVGVLWLIYHWWKTGRDPKGTGTIIAQYEAPDGLTPGEVGVIYDQRAQMHDITATVIHLAEQGYLHIRDDEPESKKKKNRKYTLIKQRDINAALPRYEIALFDAIFTGKKKEVKLDDLKDKFYKHVPKIRSQLYDDLVEQGYYPHRPDTRRGLYFGIGAGLIMIGLASTPILIQLLDTGLYFLIALLGVAFMIAAPLMPRRTRKGATTYEYILGFRRYLMIAEKERLKFFNSPEQYQNLFERFLPFAVALKVEEEWAKQFEGKFEGTPEWYEGGNAMNAIAFTSSLSSMTQSVSSTMTSSPSSSGSSGGGFSGGGFSGGGGGSW